VPITGIPIRFIYRANGIPDTWLWEFGDGSVSYEQYPSHIYNKAGIYTVSLTVSLNGSSNKSIRKIRVYGANTTAGSGLQDQKLSSSFEYYPANPDVGTTVQFTDKSTSPITSWSWRFGDGSTSTLKNPTHAYSSTGSYNVTLTVSNGTSSNSMTQTITVKSNLVADFSFSPGNPTSGEEIQFLDNSQGSPSSWSWDFGDGGKSTSKNPAHSYSQTGSYGVKLTVSNGTNSSTKQEYLTVSTSSTGVIKAASCAFVDVQAAIAKAKPGDTVLVPAGEATWNSKLVIDKGIILKGAGIDKTVIHNGYDNANDPQSSLIRYAPSDLDANWPFRITGFTFHTYDKCDTINLVHWSKTSLTIQTKIRIDHNKFTATGLQPAIRNNGMRGVIDNNEFHHSYPIRHSAAPDNGQTWWNNWEGIRYGKPDNNMYIEDNIFYDVGFVMDSQYANRYVFRYNTVYYEVSDKTYFGVLDSHGNQGEGWMYGSFGGEVYGNLIIFPDSGASSILVRFLDHRGGRFVCYMNTVVRNYGTLNVQDVIRDTNPDWQNPETNPDYQFPYDSYFFLNRKNYNGAYWEVGEGTQTDNPPFYNCPTRDRDYFVGTDKFDGSAGVGYGPLARRPANPTTIGVGYWATDQDITNLEGKVGKNPSTPISGTLYKCTAPGVWTAYFKPYTYPHHLRTILND